MIDRCISFFIRLLHPLANGVYAVFKLFPIKNRIVLLSRQSDEPPLDFVLLAAELVKQDINIIVETNCIRFSNNRFGFIRGSVAIFRQMHLCATSKIVVLDGYNPVICYLNQRPSLVVIQIWHAIGAIKKFSYQSLDMCGGRSSKISKFLRLHKNYDVIACGADEFREIYAEAFNADISKIIVMSLPRIDYLQSTQSKRKKELRNIYPELQTSKRIVLYAPTFRSSSSNPAHLEALKNLIEACKKYDLKLLVSLHPRMLDLGDELIGSDESTSQMSIFDLLLVADFVISDYSAIAFEAAAAGKIPRFYIYDIDEFKTEFGLNIDPRISVPDITFERADTLIEHLVSGESISQTSIQFFDTHLGPCASREGTATGQLARYILGRA